MPVVFWRLHYGGPVALGAAVLGAVLCVLGVLCLAGGLLPRTRGPRHALLRVVPLEVAVGFVSALIAALALGLAGGVMFGAVQVVAGPSQFFLPDQWASGMLLGLGCGVVFGCGAWWVPQLPRGTIAGLALGLAVGLALFRLVFGFTAGFGNELDAGVGTEVELVCGLMGGLAGALIGTLAAPPLSADRPVLAPETRRAPLWVGMLGGLVAAVAFALVGQFAGWFVLMLPYVGRTPECAPAAPTACVGPSPAADALGFLYGLGIFGLGGLLVGGLVGVLVGSLRGSAGGTWRGAALTAGLVGGLATGLAAGIQHRDVGGPLLPGWHLVPDPVAGGWGLGLGLLGGLAGGMLCGALLRWVDQRPEERVGVCGVIVVALGVTVLLLPVWFVPVVGVHIR